MNQPTTNVKHILDELRQLGEPQFLPAMANFGINIKEAFGVRIPKLRKLAKVIGKDHKLALELWKSGYHEARILASMIDDPKLLTKNQMDDWVKDFNSWDLCDQCCNNLFVYSRHAYDKALEWHTAKDEFTKRAGFVLMAVMAVHKKDFDDTVFEEFLTLIKKESTDERNFVKKAVNWALRQIGKRNVQLNKIAIKSAEDIYKMDSKSEKWIASNALNELTNENTRIRMK
jgi:3-methyladenine DNA glycosylase AlkD